MKLWSATATPYGRKVEVVAIETGLIDHIEIVRVSTAPSTPHAGLGRENPLIKVPTLVLPDGRAIYDSLVICDYLDTLHGEMKVIPQTGPRRWEVLTLHALGSGICDAALLCRYEQTLRPEALRWPQWIDDQLKKIGSALDWLEENAGTVVGSAGGAHVDVGQIAAGCALGYLDFRFAHLGWRASRPRLAAWFAELSKRPSMQRTIPAG